MKIQFDTGPLLGGSLLANPRRIIRADTPEDIEPAFRAIADAQERRTWLAGYFSFELGYCLVPKLASLLPADRNLPLLLVGEFEECTAAPPLKPPAGSRFSPSFTPVWKQGAYRAAYNAVQDYISAGDCYQINLTFPINVQRAPPPPDFYAALRNLQPVGFGAYVDLGPPILLSRSPELFFEVDAEGAITTRPMKGTILRPASATHDGKARDWLARSEKNRAENLMIVDMLRNDLSRISEIGSVRVPQLFTVESYATVHQMTSTVTANLLKGIRLPDILAALFPCGSVTGAPKIRAMEIIRELEPWPRTAYCGAIGWVAPNGAMSFNVAIRTLIDRGDGDYTLNVGGGLVHDSRAEAEYEEALWKSRFAQIPAQISD